ncbi:MAG: SOS response-associated peptidase [Halomonas sp.]|nr:SOS response-associated peptidase [Halomonas sp.]
MCGRFALFSPLSQQANKVDATRPRYNVAPGTWVTAIRQPSESEAPFFDDLWWGYRPAWAKGKNHQSINARFETVATNAYFKTAFSKQQCIILTDGWYKWIKNTNPKQPHFICRQDRSPLFFTGLYAKREDGTLGCAIITEPTRGNASETFAYESDGLIAGFYSP